MDPQTIVEIPIQFEYNKLITIYIESYKSVLTEEEQSIIIQNISNNISKLIEDNINNIIIN